MSFSHLVPMLTIIAKHKIGHGFISPLNLDLYVASFVTIAKLTPEHSLEVNVGLDELLFPVCSLIPESFFLMIKPLLPHFF